MNDDSPAARHEAMLRFLKATEYIEETVMDFDDPSQDVDREDFEEEDCDTEECCDEEMV